MTQIKKAFEAAAKDAALKNFTNIFSKALKSCAEQTLTEEINKLHLPEVKAKEIASLQPEKTLNLFLVHIEDAMRRLFQDACLKTYAASYSSNLGSVYKKALENINAEIFRPVETELIADYLNGRGAPAAFYTAGAKIFEAFYAKTLLAKLTEAAATAKDREFVSLIDELSNSVANETMLTMLDLAAEKPRTLYMASFTKHLISMLISVYKMQQNGANNLNNVKKQVLSAFITR